MEMNSCGPEMNSCGPESSETQKAFCRINMYLQSMREREMEKGKENQNFHGSGSSGYLLRLSDIPPPYSGYDRYYRDSDPNGPREDLMHDAQLAIASYNKTQSQRYTVVDIIRSEMYSCAGFNVYIDFLAKQDDADAITFRANLWRKIGGYIEVLSIRPITQEEAASKRIRDDVDM